MKVKIINASGGDTGKQAELVDGLFAALIKPVVVHEVVRATLNNKRRATAATKNRGEVRGGGKKPWKQKGTGRARAGSIRSPLWKGGGVTFGPTPERNYSTKVNKRARQVALRSVLTDRAKNGQVVVVEAFSVPSGKAIDFLNNLKQLQVLGKVLIVLPKVMPETYRAGRNLPTVRINQAGNLNVLDILWAKTIVLSQESLDLITKRFAK